MMVPKIITHAALVVAQSKKDRFRVLGRRNCLKIKRHSPPASHLSSSTNVSATRLERRSRTVQRLCSTLSEKPSQTAAWQLECSHPHKKRVGIGRRGEEISSRYCWSFFFQETWFSNSRFGWRMEAFLLRC